MDSSHADTLHLMGLLSLDAKQHYHALEWINRAVKQDPRPEYLSSLGTTLHQQGRHEDALKAFDQAAQLRPGDSELWKNRGNVLIDLRRPADAVSSFQQTLTFNPRDWDATYRCGVLLHEMQRPAEALVYFDLVDKLQPNQAVILEMRAAVLHNLKRSKEALADNRRAHVLNPRNAATCNNIGAALQVLGRDEEALPWFELATKLRPDFIDALTNKAASLQQLHRFDEAAATYRHAKTVDPSHAEADWSLSLLELLTGNFEEGWALREARWRRAHTVAYPKFLQPKWLGRESIEGKTILVHVDEGLGDCIQFARYVPELAARGARVILVVLDAVYPLLSKLPGVTQCLPLSAVGPRPAFDMHCPMSSLPLALRTRLDTIPSATSYLPPPAATRVQAWEARLGPRDKLRVGLVWSGNPDHKNDHNRSTSLAMLSRILDVDATFVSLQKDPRPDDQAALRERPDILDFTADLTDFSETAALVSCLDLVITVDTSVAHLAAALGCPTWILLPYTPDYRWLLDRDDSPWYPTARLFRQTKTRDYAEVLDRVRSELLTLISGPRQRETTTLGEVAPLDPTTPAALYQAALDHRRAGRDIEARSCCRQALTADPNHPDTLHLMGLLSLDARQPDQALTWISRAIRQTPRAEYLASLAITLRHLGRHEEALQSFDKAVQANPDDAELWKNRGNTLMSLSRPIDALQSFQQALELNPRYWEAASGCGILLHELGRFEEALAHFDRSDELRPNHASTIQMRALLLRNLKRFEESLAQSQRAHALNPGDVETQHNIGDVLQTLCRSSEALQWFDRALKLQPDSTDLLSNKAVALSQLRRFEEAYATYDRLKALDPDNAVTGWNLALLHLLTGNFAAGWAGREVRWKIPSLSATYPKFHQPIWLGEESIEGKTILICSDEGLGDAIQFARYVPEVAALGARVILVVDSPARSLLSALPGVSLCLTKSVDPLPAFDMHCPMCSLPLAFGTRLDTIPSATPYLPVPAQTRLQAWNARLGPHDRLRVGLVWSGNPEHKNDHNRSIPLSLLSRILDIDATFVSLQKDPKPDARVVLREHAGIADFTADLTDLSETAALACCLDLVISVDTSVAHLAAALGRPTWILLPYTPDFRWLLDRDDSPWYASVRLFRQSETSEYTSVLDRLRSELQALVSQRREREDFASFPTRPDTFYDIALGHRRAGRHPEARVSCQQALAADPGHPDSLHLMGQLSFDARQYDQAIEWIARAIRQAPKPEYLSSLGITLQQQGRHQDALQAFDKAVQLRPDDAGLWKQLADGLIGLQRPADALLSLQHALKLDPCDRDIAYKNLFLLHSLGRFEEALSHFDRYDQLRPDHVPALQLRALSLRGLQRFEESLADNERAIAIEPDNADTCNNLGDALQSLGRQLEALQWFERAIELRPDLIQALKNRAFVLTQLHRFDEAAATYQRILVLDPANAAVECDLAQLELLLGNFEAGWTRREARWKLVSTTYPKFSQPMWLGKESVEGKTILVYADEGMGDSIQFARYVPMLTARGARVILAVEAPALPLLAQLADVSQCLAKPVTTLPAFDMHCPMCSLPLAFGTRLDNIPSGISYLPRPPDDRVRSWERRLGPRDKLRVGLVWSGNPLHGNDRNRSIPLASLSRVLECDASFVSLQKDPRPADHAILRQRADIVDLTADLTDFRETAALVSCLDLVITVDTSVAHLSAALGCPTWILLPYVPDYRWLLDRDDSPWYPAARLFRQNESRDYESVLDRLATELRTLILAERHVEGAR